MSKCKGAKVLVMLNLSPRRQGTGDDDGCGDPGISHVIGGCDMPVLSVIEGFEPGGATVSSLIPHFLLWNTVGNKRNWPDLEPFKHF